MNTRGNFRLSPDMLPVIICCTLLFSLTACLPKTVLLNRTDNPADVAVYIGQLPDKEFTEIYFFQVSGTVVNGYPFVLKALKNIAKSKGCDAVIRVDFKTLNLINLFDIITLTYPQVEAVGIKFREKTQ